MTGKVKELDSFQLYTFTVFNMPSEISVVKNEPMFVYGNEINPNYARYQLKESPRKLTLMGSYKAHGEMALVREYQIVDETRDMYLLLTCSGTAWWKI